MRLTVVGASGSLPGPDSAASCYLLEAEGFRVLLDLGNGALGPLQRHVGLDAVDAVLLSHLHPDHCLDLCPYYVARRYRPGGPLPRIPVYGPAGTADRMARAYDLSRRPGMTKEFDFRTWKAGSVGIGPFRVTVDRVAHPVETFGMRLEHGGRVLAYSGDTDESPALVRLARDADVFLCEASFHDGRDAAPGLHLNGRQAAEQATAAGAERLLLTHLPPWNDPDRTLAEAAGFPGRVDLARAGTTYEV